MHSPRRSASELTRPRPISSASQPGKSPADEVAGSGRRRPARDQHQRRRRWPRPRRGRARRVLVIQQAEEIFPPLADHDAAALLRRVRIEPVEFAVDLALQIARIGREPDRRPGSSRPTGWPARYSRGSFRRRSRPRRARRAARRGSRAARRRRRPRRRNRPVAAASRRRRRAATASRCRASSGETGSLPGGGGGARSCHSGRFCQTRSPWAFCPRT